VRGWVGGGAVTWLRTRLLQTSLGPAVQLWPLLCWVDHADICVPAPLVPLHPLMQLHVLQGGGGGHRGGGGGRGIAAAHYCGGSTVTDMPRLLTLLPALVILHCKATTVCESLQ
jgi:hypothetical protein